MTCRDLSKPRPEFQENMWHRWPTGERMGCTGPDYWLFHGIRCVCGCAWCLAHKITGAAVSDLYPRNAQR